MPSRALESWRTERALKLDEIEAAHSAVGGGTRGRKFTTLQINQSYAVMVSSQFQGFCRDLHDECIDHLVGSVTPVVLQTMIQRLLANARKIDRGNPNPGHLGSDFDRFGLRFWPSVQARDRRVTLWQSRLEMLTDWRNAIAHQSFDPNQLHGIVTLRLRHVRQWRNACQGLARGFDQVMGDHLRAVTGSTPW